MDYYRNWYPWFTDGKHPFASLATPEKLSHHVRQYDEPGVSVVIPVGPGHKEMVSQALDSLESQSYRKWEAIVVWDCESSSDLKTAYPYIREVFVNDYPKGAGYARNRGAEIARAPLLLFLDADDWIYPNFLIKTLQAHTDTGDAIYTDYVGIADVDDLTKLASPLQERVKSYKDGRAIISHHAFDFDCNKVMRQPQDNPWLWCNITTLIRTDWHHEIGGFDEKMPSWEDWLYWIKIARMGHCFTRIPEPLLVYRFYTGGRRDWAHSGQNWKDLIQYIRGQLPLEGEMGCRGCGKKTSVPSRVISSPPIERSSVMQDSDFRMCLYQHPNKGDHNVNSVVRDIGSYGYRSDGDRFLVHVADIQNRPSNFIVEEIKLPGLTAKPTPEPISIADIGKTEIEAVAAQNVKMLEIKAEARAATTANMAQVVEPVELPVPVVEPYTKPIVEPVPIVESVLVQPVKLEPESEPEPVVVEPIVEPVIEPEPVPVVEPEPEPKPKPKKRRVTRKKVQ